MLKYTSSVPYHIGLSLRFKDKKVKRYAWFNRFYLDTKFWQFINSGPSMIKKYNDTLPTNGFTCAFV